jgi:predicted RNA-binding Zn ribbon-like protein
MTTLTVRAHAYFRRNRLIRELATGADPEGTTERALCAARLVAPGHRRGLAASIRNVVDAAMEPRLALSSSAPLAREQIRVATPALLALASRLRAPEDVTPRGAALVEQLLRDGSSVLYASPEPGDVDTEVRAAKVALDAGPLALR